MKKWLIIFGIAFIVQIPFNLHYHAYYYATHMKNNNSKYYRFVPLLGNNYLPDNYVPSYQVVHQDLREATLNEVKKTGKKGDSFRLMPELVEYKPKNGKKVSYIILSRDGKLIDTKKELKHEKKAYRYLNDVENEIRQNSRRPIINLQWLWNMWYQASN
ncbi:hypothetical protein [Limosilactobacillus albertensis]|uniref:Uncharacterized protein n=2 Tax=Limosilactobacillus albertensis TaxID=2759752 RepID=A0A839GYR0_9LACO|nr:hypothetical protein [Limosilactobacillus albertensis]MBB1123323.1 hypothetical protein [Limosilactobacillus albertensis]